MRELAKRIETMRSRFAADFPNWANNALGAAALAMILKRWRTTGQAPDGALYKPYSFKPSLVGASSFRNKTQADKFFKKNKNKKGEEKKLEWFTVRGHHLALMPGGYKQLRNEQGMRIDRKDFNYRAELIKTIRPSNMGGQADISTVKSPTGFLTVAGTENPLSIKKLEGNEKREGKVLLGLNKQEEADLQTILDQYITNIVNKALNG